MDKIHEAPTIDSVLRTFRQLKRNAQCVTTTWGGGGGQLGYLALVLSDDVFNAISNAVPFVRPSDPGLLVITTSKTNDIAQQQVDYNEIKHNYNEC